MFHLYIPGRRVHFLWFTRCIPFAGYSCRIRVF